MRSLSPQEVKRALGSVPEWRKTRGKTPEISRTFQFPDFAEAIRFVNSVARLAEKVQHHPDILVKWNQVTLNLSTHSAGGLTGKDFELAERLDALAIRQGAGPAR